MCDLIKFRQPDDENAKVWRYMDLEKFISLIVTNCLYFSRCDKFEDPYEGLYPKNHYINKKEEKDDYFTFYDFREVERMFTYVNCWHINEFESAAMWELYSNLKNSIAIESTYKQLKAINSHPILENIGLITYLDYEKDLIKDEIAFPFMFKRKSFEHEKEVRLSLQYNPKETYIDTYYLKKKNEKEANCITGIFLKVDLKKLINKIHISPKANNNLKYLIMDILKKYNLSLPIEQSNLYTLR